MKLYMGTDRMYDQSIEMNPGEWMDFIYRINNDPNGHKLVNKDNVHKLIIVYHYNSRVRRSYQVKPFKWFVNNKIRNKIVHNYE